MIRASDVLCGLLLVWLKGTPACPSCFEFTCALFNGFCVVVALAAFDGLFVLGEEADYERNRK